MPRFFLNEKNFISPDSVRIDGDDAVHISKSLRMRAGEELTVCDLKNYEYICEISSFSQNAVILKVLRKNASLSEPTVNATLYQCLPKSDKMDLIVQKCVELGISEIVPVLSERCISRPDEKSMPKKTERWNKIAEEASKQCGRAKIPIVYTPIDYKTALIQMQKTDCGFVCYECEDKTSLKSLLEQKKESISYSFLIGPEGGLSEEEAAFAKEIGIPTTGLGKRILRTETAPIFVISSIMFYTDNMN